MLGRFAKHLGFLGLLVLASSVSFSGTRDCPESLRHVLQSTSFLQYRQERIAIHGKNGLRTTWGEGDEILALNRPYRKMKLEHPWEPFVPVGKESLGEKNPELVFLLDDICHYQLDLPRFEEEFIEAFRKKPNAHDYVSFYESRFSIFEDGLAHWMVELRKTNPEKAPGIESSYQRKVKELRAKISEFHADRGFDQVKSGVEGFQSNVFGMMGELYAIAGIPKVKTASTLLSEMPEVVAALEKKMALVRERVRVDPEFFHKLEQDYPNVFQSMAIQNQFKDAVMVSVEKKLDFIQRWIKQKEIDVVRSSEGIDTWLELKTKRHPMTVEEFTKDRKGLKSPERQMLEDREILEFLELSSKIKLEYLVTSGIKEDLWQMLERMGVKPIDFKTGPIRGKGPTIH
ncbi:MAG: hypothetical protein KGP28_01005 [Bdellovibrionales bacterium]|nr:hypothetical protein [Bdellovibrionales bacterium]